MQKTHRNYSLKNKVVLHAANKNAAKGLHICNAACMHFDIVRTRYSISYFYNALLLVTCAHKTSNYFEGTVITELRDGPVYSKSTLPCMGYFIPKSIFN